MTYLKRFPILLSDFRNNRCLLFLHFEAANRIHLEYVCSIDPKHMHILVFLLGLLRKPTVVDLDHELPIVQGLRDKGEETRLPTDG